MAASTVLPPPPTESSDFETTWTYLERGLDLIMTSPESVPYKSFMSLYVAAYNYSMSTKHPPTHSNAGAQSADADLYVNIARYFVTYLNNIRDKANGLQEEELLTYYADEWQRYTAGAQYINRLFTYLNRHYIKKERDGGKKDVYPVYTLALVQWKEHLLAPMQQQNDGLTIALLHLTDRQRNGEIIDQNLLKRVVDSFVALGLNDSGVLSPAS